MESNKELKKSIDKLTAVTMKSSSLGWSFLRGLVTAVGGTIGLAILITIAIYALTKVPETSVIGKFFNAIATIINLNQK